MGMLYERWYPSVFGLFAAGIYIAFFKTYRAPDTAKDLLAASISIGAIAVGFLANMKAVLFTIDKKRIVQQLKDVNYYNNIVDYLFGAIVCSSILSLVSAVGIIVDLKAHPNLYPYAVAAWVGSAVAAIASYWRVLSLFTTILRSQ